MNVYGPLPSRSRRSKQNLNSAAKYKAVLQKCKALLRKYRTLLRKHRSTGCCCGGANGEDEIFVPHRRYGVVDDACLLVLVVDQNCCNVLQFVAVFGSAWRCVAVY